MARDQIREHMKIIGADGVYVGTVARVEGNHIKLTKQGNGFGAHRGRHHYIPLGLVADVRADRVRLSAKGSIAAMLKEERDEG